MAQKVFKRIHVVCVQDLSNNGLKSAGARYVAQMLLDNVSLKILKLSGKFHYYCQSRDMLAETGIALESEPLKVLYIDLSCRTLTKLSQCQMRCHHRY